MKRIIKLLSSAATAAIIAACNGTALEIDTGETMPDPGPEVTPKATLSFSKEEIEIGGSMFNEGEATMITNQTVFSASASETWVNPVFEGKILKAVAAEANDTGAERTATITVIAGKDDNTATATISVRQGIRDASSEKLVLNISDPNALLGADMNQTATVAFESNGDNFTITIPEDATTWLSAEIVDKSVVFTSLTENATGKLNSSVVTLTATKGDETLSENITVNQETKTPQGITVGAIYENEGIIFEVTEEYIKIMSLKEGKNLNWSNLDQEVSVTGTDNPDDGYEYSQKLFAQENLEENYPAAFFCKSQGEGWYMPSRRELKTIRTNLGLAQAEITNETLATVGGDPIFTEQDANNSYWSCCESSKNLSKAWRIMFKTSTTPDQEAYKCETAHGQSQCRWNVRAVKKITLN